MSFQPRFRYTRSITDALARIERARGFLEAASLSEEWLASMRKKALLLEAHHTTHIEGTRLTLAQSRRLLSGLAVMEADPEDARELLNYRTAFGLVEDALGSGEPVTESLIREIHKQLVEGVRGGSAAPGEYRRVQNFVVNAATGETVYTPPPAYEVPILMAELVSWLRETDEHAILASGIAQFQLVDIHPFLDGNGRTARLLSTLWLYRSGNDFERLFTLSERYDRDRAAYYRAIQSVREQGRDLTTWLEYYTEALASQLSEVQAEAERGIQASMRARAEDSGLKERPLRILDFLLAEGRATMSGCERQLGIHRRTLQRDLRRLVEAGLVREIATSRTDPTKHYEPIVDLPPRPD